MNKSFYFSHDYFAAEDHKIMILTSTHGWEAYGLFWYLVEKLAHAEGYLPTKVIPLLAKKAGVEASLLNGIIYNFELFIIKDDKFYSQRLIDNLTLVKELSDKGKALVQKRWDKKEQPKQMVF